MANIAAQVAHRAGHKMEGPTVHKRITDKIMKGAHVRLLDATKAWFAGCSNNILLVARCDVGDTLIDPYLKVALMPWRITGKTKTKFDQQDDAVIKYDEDIDLLLPDDPSVEQQSLIVQAWDEDVGNDTLLGQTDIEWKHVRAAIAAPGVPQDLTVTFKDAENEPCGLAQLSITHTPETPDSDFSQQNTGKYKGNALGNLAVRVADVEGLHNPYSEISTTADDSRLIVKCILLAAFYFGLGAAVFINLCKKNGDPVKGEDGEDLKDESGEVVLEKVNWTFVDSLYFAVVTITTTGYGDLLPDSDASKLFACFFAYFGVGVIAAVMGFLLAIVVEKHSGQNLLDQVKHAAADALHKAEDAISHTLHIHAPHMIKIPCLGHVDRRKIPWKYIRAGGALLLFKFAGALYFHYCDSELPFLDSIYLATITMTSVGYGEFSPSNQAARAFAIFWILGGTLLVGNFFGMLVDDYMSYQQRKLAKRLLSREFGAADMKKLDKDGDGEVTEVEFFTYMVVKLGKTDKKEVENLRAKFAEIDKSGDGFITQEDLEMAKAEMDQQRAERVAELTASMR